MDSEIEKRIIEEVPKDDSTSHGEKMLLYWLIRELKPKVLVETGTHRGLTTLYMAAACKENGFGLIHTYDPNNEWGQLGNFGKFLELQPFIVFHHARGDSCDAENVDFFFCDGFHANNDVLEEMAVIGPNLSEVSAVVFHDCWYGNTDGVNEAVEKLGLKTIWLPTKNALRIYSKHPEGMKGPL